MAIIRDNDLGGLAMIPLFVDWGVRRCNVRDCKAQPTTIVTQLAEDVSIAGFCETHFQEANKPSGANFTLEFDDYDAFEVAKEEEQNDSNESTV